MTTFGVLSAVALWAAGNALHAASNKLHKIPFMRIDPIVWFTLAPWAYHNVNHYLVTTNSVNPMHVRQPYLFRLPVVTVAVTEDYTNSGADGYSALLVLLNFMESDNLLEGRNTSGHREEDETLVY